MPKEEMRVDTEELRRQIIDSTEKEGLAVKVYCPLIEMRDFVNGNMSMPMIDVEGSTNPLTTAFTVSALETAIKELKSKSGVKEMLSFINMFATCQNAKIDRKEKKEDD